MHTSSGVYIPGTSYPCAGAIHVYPIVSHTVTMPPTVPVTISCISTGFPEASMSVEQTSTSEKEDVSPDVSGETMEEISPGILPKPENIQVQGTFNFPSYYKGNIPDFDINLLSRLSNAHKYAKMIHPRTGEIYMVAVVPNMTETISILGLI